MSEASQTVVDLQYPIGRFDWPQQVARERRIASIEEIAAAPVRLRAAVEGLGIAQLETPYRPGGWSVRQLVHHVADSHMNSFIRFKLALTEKEPVINPYDQGAWAELPDGARPPVETSLALITALHERWTVLLRSMDDAAFARAFRHPELGRVSLDVNTCLYAWHSRHHVAHITALRERMGWK